MVNDEAIVTIKTTVTSDTAYGTVLEVMLVEVDILNQSNDGGHYRSNC